MSGPNEGDKPHSATDSDAAEAAAAARAIAAAIAGAECLALAGRAATTSKDQAERAQAAADLLAIPRTAKDAQTAAAEDRLRSVAAVTKAFRDFEKRA
jgi:hypothetical protein